MFDAHAHWSAKKNSDFEGIINLIGQEEWETLNLSPFHSFFIGILPEKLSLSPDRPLENLLKYLRQNSLWGVGECGLDRRFYKSLSKERQIELFLGQIDLAINEKRPLCIHQVGAPGAILTTLEELFQGGKLPSTMIHSFQGSKETLLRLVSLGCFISFGPRSPLSLVQNCPLSKLLIESDLPVGDRQKEALDKTYSSVSSFLRIDKESLISIVRKNGTIFTNR